MRISDWSSDVCSSDLGPPCPRGNAMRSGHLALLLLASLLLSCASPGPGGKTAATPGAVPTLDPVSSQQWAADMAGFAAQDARQPPPAHPVVFTGKIGSASCRERVCPYV